jgi:hypothetical protein
MEKKEERIKEGKKEKKEKNKEVDKDEKEKKEKKKKIIEENVIKFYSHRKTNGYLSNFYPAAFELDGKEWPTSEHYFQA